MDYETARDSANKVYNDDLKKRDISGYKLVKSLSNDENSVYVNKDETDVIYAQRGSHTAKDWLYDDVRLGADELTDIFERNTGIPIRKAGDKVFLPKRERREKTNKLYIKIKNMFPNANIHLTGHSLASSLTKHILHKHDDKNIRGYGFNSAPHRDFENKIKEKYDYRYIPYRSKSNIGTGDIVSSLHDAYYPNVREIKTKKKFHKDPFSLHLMDNFY